MSYFFHSLFDESDHFRRVPTFHKWQQLPKKMENNQPDDKLPSLRLHKRTKKKVKQMIYRVIAYHARKKYIEILEQKRQLLNWPRLVAKNTRFHKLLIFAEYHAYLHQ